MGDEKRRAWWISWYSPAEVGLDQFELHSPWWVSGYSADDENIIVAAVLAVDERAAWAVVADAYDNPTPVRERFIEPLDQVPFCDRWRKADWMAWDPEAGVTCACGKCPEPERLEHSGHGEGFNTFIGRVAGCPACDAETQKEVDAATDRWVKRLADYMAEKEANPEGSWELSEHWWTFRRPGGGWAAQMAIPVEAVDSFPPLVEARAEIERLRSLTEGDPTSVYHELAEARAEVERLRSTRFFGAADQIGRMAKVKRPSKEWVSCREAAETGRTIDGVAVTGWAPGVAPGDPDRGVTLANGGQSLASGGQVWVDFREPRP